jgi:dTDP-4-amino-4,6-dideoxygalactose transaminase
MYTSQHFLLYTHADHTNTRKNNIMSQQIPFFSLERQTAKLSSTIIPELQKIIQKNAFIGGDAVQTFENQLAGYLSAKHVISCASGTDALWMALRALDCKPNTIILTTPFSFISSASEISANEAHPLFIDIEKNTYNIDPVKLSSWLKQNAHMKDGTTYENKTNLPIKGMVVVNIFGQCADFSEIKKITSEWNLWLIEDACQAIGSHIDNKMAGTFGDISCFSFYPTKNLGAWGDGGAISTNNDKLADTLRKLRNHGRASHYEYEFYGRNSRFDAMQAVVLQEKLKVLDKLNNRRREIAEIYNQQLQSNPYITCPQEVTGHSVYHQYCVTVTDKNGNSVRDALKAHLEAHKIGSVIFYPKGLNNIPFINTHTELTSETPISDNIIGSMLALPIWPELTNDEVLTICKAIESFKP